MVGRSPARRDRRSYGGGAEVFGDRGGGEHCGGRSRRYARDNTAMRSPYRAARVRSCSVATVSLDRVKRFHEWNVLLVAEVERRCRLVEQHDVGLLGGARQHDPLTFPAERADHAS